MKKSLITIILCTVAMGVGYAQFTDGLVLQPTSVVAKRFDASGQLIKEMTSTYSYDGVGSSNKVTFRTSGFFEVTGPFQVDGGGELTVIMQQCPE